MSVYVDDMYKYPMGQFNRMKMSHMIADTEEELHSMAARIGVARKWYQGDHYDICMSMRNKAISYGAVAITLKELAIKSKEQRKSKITQLIPNEEADMFSDSRRSEGC